MSKQAALIVMAAFLFTPALCIGQSDDAARSAYWSHRFHEENSLFASLIYFPYGILRAPLGILSGISDPKPTTQATVPPPAHKYPYHP